MNYHDIVYRVFAVTNNRGYTVLHSTESLMFRIGVFDVKKLKRRGSNRECVWEYRGGMTSAEMYEWERSHPQDAEPTDKYL